MSRLRLDGVGVRAGVVPLVADVSIDCAPGTFVGLLGPNGSGKSTVLKTVYRALAPAAGAVLVDERDVRRELTARQAARRVAVVAQEPGHDFDFTVDEVVAAGRTPHHRPWARLGATDRAVVAGALNTVGLDGHGSRPFGELSGGEKQRVLLARALAQQPAVLVLDEPTNHLDIGTQLGLLTLVRGLRVTVLAALHDLNLAAAFCDRVHVMHDGAVVARGTPDEVLTPELIATVFGVFAHRTVHPGSGRAHLIFATDPLPCTTSEGPDEITDTRRAGGHRRRRPRRRSRELRRRP